MNPSDFTLLAIDSAHGALSPVQLQKSLFLLGAKAPDNVLPSRERYVFKPYDYGPFCAEIYSDAEELEQRGLIEIRRPPMSRYKEYVVTPAGHDYAAQLRSQDRWSVAAYLQQLVNYTQSLGFNQLVASVYEEFPEMKANSVFRDRA